MLYAMGKARVRACVAAVMLLAGCSAPDGGPGRPTGPPAAVAQRAGPAVAGAVYGALNQLDPCGFVVPAAFEPYGVARVPGRPDMDDCHVTVDTDEGTATVRIGTVRSPVDLPNEERTTFADLGRGVTVQQLPQGCDMLVVPGGGFVVSVTVDLPTNEDLSDETRCYLAYGGALGVFEVLATGEVRHWAPAPNSFAALGACTLLAENLVSEQLDQPVLAKESLTRHSCAWNKGGSPSAELYFPVARSTAEAGVPPETPYFWLGGRKSWVVPERVEDRYSCTVYTQHIAFGPGEGTFEFAALRVWWWQDSDERCDVARELAADAWARLPT